MQEKNVISRDTEAAVQIKRLCFRWPRQSAPCLQLDAVEVAAGERLFIHGESGSGKSTLLNLVAGVLLPESGSITLFAQDLAALSASARDRFRVDHLGFIFQQFNLIPYLSVLDNVLLPCRFSARRRMRAMNGNGDESGEARRLLAALDLGPELLHRPAAELSVGQQQRVSAARALIGRPELVVADEPTSALDAARQAGFVDLLLAEARSAGSTVLFVSHDLRLATHFDRALELSTANKALMPEESACAI